jgi:hypothetical protein
MSTAPEIFISYAWGDEKETGESREQIVDSICNKLEGLGMNIVRDKKEVRYKGNITEFENRLGSGNYIILVISHKFLRSRHCMYEVLKISEHRDVYKRIFPVVLPDAKIYNEEDVLDHIDFWNSEIERLQARIKRTGNIVYINNIQQQLRSFGEILRLFDDFSRLLREMNTLSPEILKDGDFKELRDALEKQIEEDRRKGTAGTTPPANETAGPKIVITDTGIVGTNVNIHGDYVAGRDLKKGN